MITVNILGLGGAGKSTIGEIISRALQAHNIEVELADDTPPIDTATLEKRIVGLKRQGLQVVVNTIPESF